MKSKEEVMKIKVTHSGDSEFKRGQVVELTYFLQMVKVVLENGGEMPIGIVIPG